MATGTSTSNKPADVFKTFPQFSKLTLADRGKYEALIRQYPPVAEISFFALVVRWSALDVAAVSLLNDNLVLSYWLPGSDTASGLSVVGNNRLDQTFCQVLDHLRQKGEAPRLVHVPEFVISELEYPELFCFKSERDHDEYVVDLDKLYPLQRTLAYRRRRVRKFVDDTADDQVVVKGLDLREAHNRDLLLGCVKRWNKPGTINGLAKYINENIEMAIVDADFLGTQNIGLYVNDELHGYVLYYNTPDPGTVGLAHALINDEIPYTYDYLVYAFAHWFIDKGIRFVNLDSDLGIPLLRAVKLGLRPVNYYRKYTVTPAA